MTPALEAGPAEARRFSRQPTPHRAAIDAGVRYWSTAGEPLHTEDEVLDAYEREYAVHSRACPTPSMATSRDPFRRRQRQSDSPSPSTPVLVLQR
jgi:hypothetical protein